MFGYACNETADLMPLPIWTAHRLAEKLAEVRKSGQLPYLRPDGKTQVTYEYEDGKPIRLLSVLVSTQHQGGIDRDTVIRPDLIEQVIRPTIPAQFADDDYEVYVNPTGSFVIGGPHGDCGLTGRKIIVDTYGGMGRHGGGAFSGKDPSKVDRSAAYAARWVAKHVVASGAAERCEIQVAYAIGMAQPLSILVETFGTNVVSNEAIEQAVRQVFDLRPGAIVRDLDLKKPGYKRTAAYGHFGRPGFTWEDTPRLDEFKLAARSLSRRSRRSPPVSATLRVVTVARVLPDVTGLDKTFDYARPRVDLRDRRVVGAVVRVELHGRRVGGWIVELDPVDALVRRDALKPIAQGHRSRSRSLELIELAGWASVRWAGRRRHFLVDRIAGAGRRVDPGVAADRAGGRAALAGLDGAARAAAEACSGSHRRAIRSRRS